MFIFLTPRCSLKVRRDEPTQPLLPPGGEVAASREQPQPAGVQRPVRDPNRARGAGHRLPQALRA